MSNKINLHLTWSLIKQIWEIKLQDSDEVLYQSLMKSEAIAKGRELAKSRKTRLIIHKKYSEFDTTSR